MEIHELADSSTLSRSHPDEQIRTTVEDIHNNICCDRKITLDDVCSSGLLYS